MSKPARKDAEGNVITDPRNFYIKKSKKGHADDVYFSRPSYVCTGDPFRQNALESMRTHIKEGYKKGGHDKDFKPAKHLQEKLYKVSYEYMALGEEKKKNKRDAEGNVVLENKNFVCLAKKQRQP